MAQRIATNIVEARWNWNESEARRSFHQLQKSQARLVVQEDDADSQVLILRLGSDVLKIRTIRTAHGLKTRVQGKIISRKLAEWVRKTMAAHRGEAEMHRIYAKFTMVYKYNRGKVMKIIERQAQSERMVFEAPSKRESASEGARRQQHVAQLKMQVDRLLDARNQATSGEQVQAIDAQLVEVTKQLSSTSMETS